MKQKILLDIDGVIADFYAGFSKHLNEHFDTDLDLSSEPSSYSISGWGHSIPDQVINAQIPLWVRDGGYINMPIYPDAKKFVYRLMDRYDVFVVTARVGDFTFKLDRAIKHKIKDDTLDWFKAHGIPADKVFFSNRKADFCKERGITALIEDKLETVVDAANEGIRSILINRGWNQGKSRNHPNIQVAYSYDEILNFLEEILG